MADQPASERTEEPTPERLRKAREEGQVPQSQEVPSALLLGSLLVVGALMAYPFFSYFVHEVEKGLTTVPTGPMDTSAFHAVLGDALRGGLMILLPFLAAAGAMSIFSSAIASGLAYCPKALKFKLDRISPVKGMKNLVSKKSLVRLLVSLAKLALILLILYTFLRGCMGRLTELHWTAPAATMHRMFMLVGDLVLRVVLALVALAVIDWLWQRHSYRKQLRMTRQEVKEERKQYEQSSEVKGRIRSIQVAMARKRMLNEVASADVVVTNPTHFAVALRYDSLNMKAPEVVAKGADFMAARIREVARENGVPVIERPPLARALYTTVDAGQAIPESLFVAVAEVLAMIYEMRRSRANA
jgi:flagellar biosynthetic protein FlhB